MPVSAPARDCACSLGQFLRRRPILRIQCRGMSTSALMVRRIFVASWISAFLAASVHLRGLMEMESWSNGGSQCG